MPKHARTGGERSWSKFKLALVFGLTRRVLLFLSVAVICLASCDGPSRPATWGDLFETRIPIRLSADELGVPSSAGAPGRWPTSSRRDSGGLLLQRIAVSKLRSEEGASSSEMAVLASSGRALATAFPKPEIVDETPYWGKGIPFFRVAASNGIQTFVASNLFYPIEIYDASGRLSDSLTQPPPSWKQAHRPRMGQFANVGEGAHERVLARERYLRDATMIIGLAVVSDSVLIVNHGSEAQEIDGELSITPTVTDVYVNGRKVATDLPSPGEILAYSRNSVFFLVRDSGQREVTEYVWAKGRDSR